MRTFLLLRAVHGAGTFLLLQPVQALGLRLGRLRPQGSQRQPPRHCSLRPRGHSDNMLLVDLEALGRTEGQTNMQLVDDEALSRAEHQALGVTPLPATPAPRWVVQALSGEELGHPQQRWLGAMGHPRKRPEA